MSEENVMNDTPEFPSTLEITSEVMAIARRLERAGHETWCVGGAVRDRLLEIPNNDVDLATSATPEEVQSLFRRTVPIGVAHGTVAVLDRHNVAHEVTTFRADVRTDGRHAEVVFGVSVDEDLARRDFTINAIAYHPVRHEWKDPHHGVRDIGARIVRAVGDPSRRFQEDYLRILRCIRFATRFGFAVEATTWKAACEHGPGLQRLSAERVRDEWFKSIAHAKNLTRLIEMWSEAGAVAEWLRGTDLSTETLEVCARALDARGVRDPIIVTAYISEDPALALEALRCSTNEVERARRIAKFRSQWPRVGDVVAVRRWMSRVGSALNDLMLISEIEGVATGLRAAVGMIQESGDALTQAELAVSGSDLLELGVPKGPAVGATLRKLLDAVLEDPTQNDKAILLRLVSRDVKDS